MKTENKMNNKIENDLRHIFDAGVARVKGYEAVRTYLREHPLDAQPVCLVAVGKAASSMALGALSMLGEQVQSGLLITKRDHTEKALSYYPQILCIESDHPVPSEASLGAGQALQNYVVGEACSDIQFVFLLSGGASSLVEVLADGMDFAQLQELTSLLLAGGYDIGQMNSVRRYISTIKGGKLARCLNDTPTLSLMISDVPGDDPAVIGSGLLTRTDETPDAAQYSPEIAAILKQVQAQSVPAESAFACIDAHIIACLDDAKAACYKSAQGLGYSVHIVDDFIEGDAGAMARQIVEELAKSNGEVFIYGGETSMILPDEPGQGGRNQHLALCAAAAMAEQGYTDLYLLAAGTDGSDGPTDAAGALVSATTIAKGKELGLDAQAYLQAANSYEFLKATDSLITTGPTGTNVMDLVIAIRDKS